MSNETFVEPFHDYVLVKPFPPDEKTEGGIIIPDSAKERMNKATVVALGELLENKKVKVGMSVFHIKGAGTLIEHNKEDYYIMKYGDLLCKV